MTTTEQQLLRAMETTDQAEADAIFATLVVLASKASSGGAETVAETERRVRENLGYMAGYYGNDVRERVERLFRCEHPVFGSIAKNGPPTPEQAFNAGVAWAEASGLFVRVQRADGKWHNVDVVDLTDAELQAFFETKDTPVLRSWAVTLTQQLRKALR